MKIAIIGANGHVGSRLTKEALDRGHEVTAIVRNPDKITFENPNMTVVAADALQPESLVAPLKGQDVVISAYNAGVSPESDQENFSRVAKHLIKLVRDLGIPRVITVGGAGSLQVAPDVRLYDTPEFPEFIVEHAKAHGKVLDLFRTIDDINWTYFSPAIEIEPGERTGEYRLGKDEVVSDADGQSKISTEDYAVAMLDEIENPQFEGQRFTVGY